MNRDLFIIRPIPTFVLLFWVIQFIVIVLSGADNLLVISILNFFLVLHFVLWYYVGEFKDKSKMIIKGFFAPIILLIIFSLLPFISNVLTDFDIKIVSGTLWINTCFLTGIIPVATGVFIIIFRISKGGKFDDSILNRKHRGKRKTKQETTGAYIIGTFWILFVFLLLILISPAIVNGFQYLLVDNESELITTVNGITQGCTNDIDKTNALLRWFDRGEGKCENMANIYYRNKQSDVDILLRFGNSLFIYSKYPHICSRGGDDFEWIYCARCGMCQEYGTLFSKMADIANLEVRKVCCEGEDHVWNEVKIDGEWIVIDATAVNLPMKMGFNLSRSFMEDKVKGDLWREGIMIAEGNVSYVYAISPDSPNKKIDITGRYTDTINISVYVFDKDNRPVSNVSVSVTSYNRLKARSTGLSNKTNEFGICNFTMGDGHYTFNAKKNGYAVKKTGTYSEKVSHYNVSIILNQSQADFGEENGRTKMKDELVIQLLGLTGAIFLSINVLLGRKGRLKLHNWLANHVSKSRSGNRKISARVYEKLFWGWEQIFGIIGLIFLLTALVWTVFLLINGG